MDKTLHGHDQASERLEKQIHQNSRGIEYPRGTNERGYPHVSKEHHAHGDQIGHESMGDASSAPGRGGSHMQSYFGKPQHGREDNHFRKNAIKQAHAENHRKGDVVGTSKRHEKKERHAMGDVVGNGMPHPIAMPNRPMLGQNMRRPLMANPMMGADGMRRMEPMPGLNPMPHQENGGSGAYRHGGRVRKPSC